jgi:hypothetical protein
MHAFVREALGLTLQEPWPPDYYTLLGLATDDVTPERVEAAVLERMERLRAYQLAHPEPVTEAMNLLANALVCLTDPMARQAYDAGLAAPGPEGPVALPLQPLADVERPRRRKRKRRRTSGGPPRLPIGQVPVHLAAGDGAVPREPRDRVRRLVAVRRLLDAWDVVGTLLAIPDLAISRRVEAVEVVAALRRVAVYGEQHLDEEGPGGAVFGLARSHPVVSTLVEMSEGRRELLSADWRAGRQVVIEAYWRARAGVGRRGEWHRLRRQLARSRRHAPEFILAGCVAVAIPVALVRWAVS